MKEGLLEERGGEEKGVGAELDHPGGALELDERLDGESSSDGWRRDKDREEEGGGSWMTHSFHLTLLHPNNYLLSYIITADLLLVLNYYFRQNSTNRI